MNHFRRWGAVDAEDLERLEKKIDALQEPFGLDPNESEDLGPDQQQEPTSAQ
jgi:hypothetical protein